jgi:hypothetical protein
MENVGFEDSNIKLFADSNMLSFFSSLNPRQDPEPHVNSIPLNHVGELKLICTSGFSDNMSSSSDDLPEWVRSFQSPADSRKKADLDLADSEEGEDKGVQLPSESDGN